MTTMNSKLKDIMTLRADFLGPNASLQEASSAMQKNDIGFLPIKENGKLVGVVTDRDIAIRGVAKGLNPNAPLEDVMTKKVFTALETDTLHTAAKLMESKKIRRLIILDHNHSITGVISLGDIATQCHDFNICGEIISVISESIH